jgi:hypothetical protein
MDDDTSPPVSDACMPTARDVKRRDGAFSSALVGMRVFSSSLWLCDCPVHLSSHMGSWTGNSMGLILDARDVHSFRI